MSGLRVLQIIFFCPLKKQLYQNKLFFDKNKFISELENYLKFLI